MTEQGPEQEAQQQPEVDTCVACGRPVQFYEAIGDGPGWWGHVHAGDSLSRHRAVLQDDERPAQVDAHDIAARLLLELRSDDAAVQRLAQAMTARDQSSHPFRSWRSEILFILDALPAMLGNPHVRAVHEAQCEAMYDFEHEQGTVRCARVSGHRGAHLTDPGLGQVTWPNPATEDAGTGEER